MCLFKFDLGKLLCPTGVLHESQIECSGAERFFDHGGGCVGIFRSAFGVCGNVQVVRSLLIKKGLAMRSILQVDSRLCHLFPYADCTCTRAIIPVAP